MTMSQRFVTVATGGAVGLAGTAVWLALVALRPPVPSDPWGAAFVVVAAMAAAAWLTRFRQPWIGALGAGVASSWSVVVAVGVLMDVVPDRWVPVIVTQGITPADNVRESRIEAVDPYVVIALWGFLMAIALVLLLTPPLARRIRFWLMPPIPASPPPQVR
jgi:hypothetical protein